MQGAECVYNGAMRITPRKAVENQAELKMHEELYRILQTKDTATAESVLKHIRQGNDIRATLRHLQEGNLHVQMAVTPQTWTRYTFPYRQEMPSFLRQPGNLYLESYLALGIEDALYKSGQRPNESLADWKAAYRIPYHASRHVDNTIESANIAKWTQATDDTDLLRELLHAYFVYDYPLFAFFHKDLFLKDLATGTGEHCSSLLVNTILALACVSTLYLVRFKRQKSPASLTWQSSMHIAKHHFATSFGTLNHCNTTSAQRHVDCKSLRMENQVSPLFKQQLSCLSVA